MTKFVDFHAVLPQHEAIHSELENWARWVRNPKGVDAMQPMFRQSKPAQHWDEVEAHDQTDLVVAAATEKAVHALPAKNCAAICWCYVYRDSPRIKSRELGVSLEGLGDLVREGRGMLSNRGRRDGK